MQPDSYQFLLIFSVATVGMLLLTGAIIIFVVFYQKRMLQEQFKRQSLEFDYQQKMMQAELSSQESERRKLAADLHDSIGGMLSTIRVGISTLARNLSDPSQVDETKQMLDDTIASVRRISRDLMPSTLEKFGLMYAVKEMCERFHGTSKIPVLFESVGEFLGMDKQRELMTFRIVQELLNNAVKHSTASTINVRLVSDINLTVTVADDGVGFDVGKLKSDKTGRGLGLFNIENRARLLNGELVFNSGQSRGTVVTLTIPLLNEKAT